MQSFGFFKAFLIFIIFILLNLIISIPLQFLYLLAIISSEVFKFLLALTFLAPFGVIYLMYDHKIKPFMGSKISNYFLYIFIVLIAFSFQIIGTTIEVISTPYMPESLIHYYQNVKEILIPKTSFDFLGALFTIGLIAPICEEYIFRGIILKGLIREKNLFLSNLFQSFLFAMAHFNPFQFLYALPIGLILGWIYWQTKNLWVPIWIHIGTNSFALLLSFLEIDIPIWKDIQQFGSNMNASQEIPQYLIYISIILLVFSLYYIKEYNRNIKS